MRSARARRPGETAIAFRCGISVCYMAMNAVRVVTPRRHTREVVFTLAARDAEQRQPLGTWPRAC
jgi:hypothetical protein